MAEILNVGDVFFAYIVIRDADGEQTASSDLTLDILKPDQSTDSPNPAEADADDLDAINLDNARNPDWTDLTSSTGVYVGNIGCDLDGSWWLRWHATDPLTFAEQQAFFVYPQRVTIP